ncbi:hypothetical protein [Dyadobacter alkalitolerans]|uniref:hypothetical protein n=1 Tax=Dyadobacter alkalitolerans TaxID=492736 RepID=UPI000478D5AF|nr:hypothetical protein [Dyadobacter alkalitolerans]
MCAVFWSHLKEQPEPANSGEIVFNNSAKAALDTATIVLYENADGTKIHLIFELRGTSIEGKESLLLVIYQTRLDIREIPEGQYNLKGDDLFHFSVGNDTSSSGGHQKQMTFTLRKIGESRYAVEFNGIANGKPISGRYSGYWGKLES